MLFSFAPASSTNDSSISWQPEPSTRGTWGILSVYIITTSLCVWTAVHPNVPANGHESSHVWRRLYWLGIGLLAPEMIAYAAWYQKRIVTQYHTAIADEIGRARTRHRRNDDEPEVRIKAFDPKRKR